MRSLMSLPALAAALLIAACDGPAEFAMPLSPPGTTPYDARLVGSWYAQAPGADGMAMLVVTPRADGVLDAAFGYMSIAPGETGHAGLEWHSAIVHASPIGDRIYYNVRLTDGGQMVKEGGQPAVAESDLVLPVHPNRGYWIIRGDIGETGILTVRILSETLPRQRELPSHDVDCGADCRFTVYDLEPAALAELIASGPEADLFDIRILFARFGAPPVPLWPE